MEMNAFKLLAKERIEELNLEAQQYEHLKTGAQVLYLPADDTNKAFNIGFNTHCEDSTGVPHILEHSVLNGSRKYPVKEPFLNMIQSSLNTFINAMTTPDTTMYPVASVNDQDFLNLMDVYLDAVFHPNIYLDPLTFRQEGWHIDLDEEGKPYFTGVVYSEMKGAMSSPDEILEVELNALLFDNLYQYNYGGEPQEIVKLSYDDFLNFHRRFYHPSNAHIILYGKMDLPAVMAKIDEFLAEYERAEATAGVQLASVKEQAQYLQKGYPSQDKKNFAGLKFVLGDRKDLQEAMRITLLSLALFNFDSSPVKRQLIEEQYCDSIYAQSENFLRNLGVSISLQGVEEARPEAIEGKILEAIRLAKDSDLDSVLHAAWNKVSFMSREADTGSGPKGIFYSIAGLVHWDERDFDFNLLRYEDLLAQMKQEIEAGKFKEYLDTYFLDNKFRATVVLKPDADLASIEAAQEAEAAQAYWDSLSAEEQAREKELNTALLKRQNTADSPEALASLPKLKRSDLEASKRLEDVQETQLTVEVGGQSQSIDLLHYEADSAGIMYLDLFFPLSLLSEDEYFAFAFLLKTLGSLDTENLDYISLSNRLLTEVGDLSFSHKIYGDKLYFKTRLKVLSEQMKPAFELLGEILTKTKFTQHERLLSLALMQKAQLQQFIVAMGSSYALGEVFANLEEEQRIKYYIEGLGYYNKLTYLCTHPELIAPLAKSLEALLHKIVQRDKLILGFTGNKELKEEFVAQAAQLYEALSPQADSNFSYVLEGYTSGNLQKLAYQMPSQVQFVALGGRFQEKDNRFDGRLHVFNQMLNSSYLWNNVRVQGGAYGCNAVFDRSGIMGFTSFRDPNLVRTLEAYRSVPQGFREMELSDEEVFDFIVGTIATFDHPYSIPLEGQMALDRYFRGLTAENLARERAEILETKAADLAYFAEVAERAIENSTYTVLGNETAIKKERKIFAEVKVLG